MTVKIKILWTCSFCGHENVTASLDDAGEVYCGLCGKMAIIIL